MINGTLQTSNFFKNDSVCKTVSAKSKRLFHFGPMIGFGIVIFLSIVSLFIIVFTFKPTSTLFGFTNFVMICLESYIILRSYSLSCWFGPGFVDFKWKPQKLKDQSMLQYCAVCEGYKPPRAHHCGSCGRCVLKMDHHCPWINCCVGHLNHGMFLQFVLSAPLGCLHCTALCCYRVYYIFTRSVVLHRWGYDYRLLFSIYEVFGIIVSIGLAFGVVLAVGGLAYFQLKSVFMNETVIENWIMLKALDRREANKEPPLTYPYDLGCRANTFQVLSLSGYPIGNGYTWPLKPGCGKYDLTIEQLKQKAFKSKASREFNILKNYSGYFFPIFEFGFRLACCIPCTAERRLKVNVGDRVLVNKCFKNWLYGYVMCDDEIKNGPNPKRIPLKGWFPSACAVEENAKVNKTD